MNFAIMIRVEQKKDVTNIGRPPKNLGPVVKPGSVTMQSAGMQIKWSPDSMSRLFTGYCTTYINQSSVFLLLDRFEIHRKELVKKVDESGMEIIDCTLTEYEPECASTRIPQITWSKIKFLPRLKHSAKLELIKAIPIAVLMFLLIFFKWSFKESAGYSEKAIFGFLVSFLTVIIVPVMTTIVDTKVKGGLQRD